METKPNEAVIMLCKCGHSHKTYGLRTEKLGRNHWRVTWAFAIRESAAKNEGYVVTKKSIKAKEIIKRVSRDFDGNLTDAEVIELVGIARNTYYKYKKELLVSEEDS